MSIFVVGIHPGSPAATDGRMRVGDELLEVRATGAGNRVCSRVGGGWGDHIFFNLFEPFFRVRTGIRLLPE